MKDNYFNLLSNGIMLPKNIHTSNRYVVNSRPELWVLSPRATRVSTTIARNLVVVGYQSCSHSLKLETASVALVRVLKSLILLEAP